MNISENILSTLTDEQKKKVEAAQTPEELLALAKETGYELSQEQLGAIAGGEPWYQCDIKCWQACSVVCLSKGCVEVYRPCPPV